jgi:hypothetical protein
MKHFKKESIVREASIITILNNKYIKYKNEKEWFSYNGNNHNLVLNEDIIFMLDLIYIHQDINVALLFLIELNKNIVKELSTKISISNIDLLKKVANALEILAINNIIIQS